MIIKISGSDELKERVIKLLQKEKIPFDLPLDIPEGTTQRNVLLWPPSGKGESKYEEFLKSK